VWDDGEMKPSTRAVITSWLLALAPLVLVPLVFVAVLRSGARPIPFPRVEVPDEPFVRDHCTWSCANHGCRHVAALPPILTDDTGLFGWAVRELHKSGDAISPEDSFRGYRAINLAIFCAAWPAVMFALWAGTIRARSRRHGLAGVRS
jgi:hypothetical protein